MLIPCTIDFNEGCLSEKDFLAILQNAQIVFMHRKQVQISAGIS